MNNKEIISIANKALNEWILTKENDIESHDAVQLIPGVSTYCFYKTDQICTGDCELSSFYIKISCETSTYIYKEPIITIMCYSSDDYMNNIINNKDIAIKAAKFANYKELVSTIEYNEYISTIVCRYSIPISIVNIGSDLFNALEKIVLDAFIDNYDFFRAVFKYEENPT